MRYLILLLLTMACGTRPDRDRELAACRLITQSGDELARCLIMKYNWGADSAGPAKAAWQWTLDSIRAEHEAQAAAVLARQRAIQDSIDAIATTRQRAREVKVHLDYIRNALENCRSIGVSAADCDTTSIQRNER